MHFTCDLGALTFVYFGYPLFALYLWLLGHILDNCDGDLARIRDEADPKWGELDVHLHLLMNLGFWVVLLFIYEYAILIGVILAARVLSEFHRSKTKIRYGERSRLWKWIAYPTNINAMYVFYGISAATGMFEVFLFFYLAYIPGIALGQSLKTIEEL